MQAGRMPSHANENPHALGEGSCHLVYNPQHDSLTALMDSLTGRSGVAKFGNEEQSSAPGHWALGTVQLRREELVCMGQWAGDE